MNEKKNELNLFQWKCEYEVFFFSLFLINLYGCVCVCVSESLVYSYTATSDSAFKMFYRWTRAFRYISKFVAVYVLWINDDWRFRAFNFKGRYILHSALTAPSIKAVPVTAGTLLPTCDSPVRIQIWYPPK